MKKYRPVLTASQIAHILYLCMEDRSSEAVRIIGALAPFKAKIDCQGVKAAYTTTPKKSLLEELEGETPENDGKTGAMYEAWKCGEYVPTLEEIQQIQEWRYSNDMLIREDEKKFENGNWGTIPIY